MLGLPRKTKHEIQVGPNITITILQIKGQAVRVGIEAPRDMCVLRTELAKKMVTGTYDPTAMAALEKFERESEISSTSPNEDISGRTMVPVNGSLRCRAHRAHDAPLSPRSHSTP